MPEEKKRLRPYVRVKPGLSWNGDEVSDGRIWVQKALVGSGCLDLKDLELRSVLGPVIGGLVSIQCSDLRPLGPRAT